MKAILVPTLVVVGLVSSGAAYAADGGACAKSPGAMLAYARPHEPKQTPHSSTPIREAASAQARLHAPTLRQPAASEQPARTGDGPLRIGSRVEGKPDPQVPGQIAMSEHPIACDAR